MKSHEKVNFKHLSSLILNIAIICALEFSCPKYMHELFKGKSKKKKKKSKYFEMIKFFCL